MGERNKRVLMELLQLPQNQTCADCNTEGPDWASIGSNGLGVFICVTCSGIHRQLGTHISRVRSCRLDQWPDDAVEVMKERGNDLVNAEMEKHIPPYYKKPSPYDPQMYKEHFIYSKYQLKEFNVQEGTRHYEDSLKEGKLFKRGKQDKQFRERRFLLNADDGTLRYFVKEGAKEPKQVIQLHTLNISLAPEKIEHPHGMQLSFLTADNSTRHIYLYAEDAKVAVDWYIAIRAATFNLYRKRDPSLSSEQIIQRLNYNQGKQGWISKTGPKHTEPYRKRWFTLIHRRLQYFASPLDAYPKGEIFLGSKSEGYNVRDGLPNGQTENGYGITIITPDREYLLCCQDKSDQKSWIEEIKKVISKPLSANDSQELQNFTNSVLMRRKSTNPLSPRFSRPVSWAMNK